jgi:hypothetical protein
MAKRKQNKNLPQSSKIVELDNLQDFKNYVGQKEIPQEPLIKQIEKLQRVDNANIVPRIDGSVLSIPDDPELGSVGKAMFLILDYTAFLVPLVTVHLVLNLLVRMQYSQDYVVKDIVLETLSTIPVLAVLHTIVHPLTGTRLFRISSFFASVAMGGYLIYESNEEGYYAVMKRAPPLGTLWVWLFIEMDWQWAATSLVVVGFWMWKKGYSF